MTFAANRTALTISATLALAALTVPAGAQSSTTAPQAGLGYSVSVFTQGVAGKYSAPDSLAFVNNHVFVGYANGIKPDGSDGKTSNIIEYASDGTQLHVYTVVGHNDGLKVDPDTQKLWAMQNEDANANLVIIDPRTSQQSAAYKFASAPRAGGGYDDIVFRNHHVYFSASNPANSTNTAPAIEEVVSFAGGVIHTKGVLNGSARATSVTTGETMRLNLQDPDSMTLDPEGDIVLDSQGDSELVIVRQPGTANQSALQISLTSPYGAAQADDTLFTPSSDGFILVSDTPANTVYAIRKAAFAPGVAFSAAVAAGSAAGSTVGFVGRLDLDSGMLTPVVTGLQSPHGMTFVKTYDASEDE